MNKEKLRKLVFSLIGFLSIALSLVSFNNETSYHYYGGDAYTGIQHAAADTANSVKFGFGSVLLISGLGFIAYAFLSEKVKEDSVENPFDDDVELD